MVWFEEKTFLVTGGSSGIGLSISRQLKDYGAKIIIISHNEEEFDYATKELNVEKGNSNKIVFFKCDITSPKDRLALKGYLDENKVDLTGIINCAGITTFGSFVNTPIESIERLVMTNFVGTILFTREFLPYLLKENSSKKNISYLVFISSMTVQLELPYFSAYPATKVGVDMFFRVLQRELPSNIRVLQIRPGSVLTNLYSNALLSSDGDIDKLLELSIKHFKKPEQIAKPLIKAIIKKKKGIIYPDFSTKMQVRLFNLPIIGNILLKSYINQIRKKAIKH